MKHFDIYLSLGEPEAGQTVHVGQVEAPDADEAQKLASGLHISGTNSQLWVDEGDEELPGAVD